MIEPSDEDEVSNLERIQKILKYSSVCDMMKQFAKMNFFFGPADHPLLKSQNKNVATSAYEKLSLELHHPDLNPDFEPTTKTQGSLRRIKLE